MFVIYNDKTRFPIKAWLSGIDRIEDSCIEQAYNLSNLPFLHKWVCLMLDTHTGKGMPIGGVIAAKDVIIPNAVGVDIGCGMVFVATDIKYEEIKDVMVRTLGGGNHFIELQEDEEGYLCIMIHSGSRHLGKEICDYFHNKARELNSTWCRQGLFQNRRNECIYD